MASINEVTLLGNLGKDPEVKLVQSNGAKVARFPLATSETYTNKSGEKVEQTEWHNIICWRGLAEVAEKYLKKGNKVYIRGKIKSRTYEDKEGVKRYVTDIEVRDLLLLDRPNTGSSNSNNSNHDNTPQTQYSQSTAIGMDDNTDDLPF